VHLPYHLLSGVQALLHPRLGAWRNWSQPLHSIGSDISAPEAEPTAAASAAATAPAETGAGTGRAGSTAETKKDDDGVDFVYYNEADQVTRFRDLPTARALTSGLLNVEVPTVPPTSSSSGVDRIKIASSSQIPPFPTSHHEKPPKGSFVEEFRAKVRRSFISAGACTTFHYKATIFLVAF